MGCVRFIDAAAGDLVSSIWYDRLRRSVAHHGGLLNAHLHLDRAGTFDDRYLSGTGHRMAKDFHVSLQHKHALIADLHAGPAYQRDDLRRRINETLDTMEAVNTRRADTLVDVTADRVGLTGLEVLLEIQAERRNRLDLRLGAYTPFGFKDSEPARWEIFVEAARRSDLIGSLPEADEPADHPGHIGSMEHLRRVLELAQDLGKMVNVHTDQRFESGEQGTEQLVQAVRRYGAPAAPLGEPMIWAVHVLSPSTYAEDRFHRMADDLAELNIGVITCPSAALGMRMLRPLRSPTWNCIPRILELLVAGVQVRLGCDNIADICSPSTTADLIDEVFVLSAALRFYEPDILAKLACGVALEPEDRAFIGEHLRHDDIEVAKVLARTGQPQGPTS